MIPIYRAEVVGIGKLAECQAKLLTKIDERYYAIGFYSFLDNEHGVTDLKGYYWKVKKETRSIHFPDMVDKNVKKCFASLSEDGVGGDVLQGRLDRDVLVYCNNRFEFKTIGARPKYSRFEVIGIHQ